MPLPPDARCGHPALRSLCPASLRLPGFAHRHGRLHEHGQPRAESTVAHRNDADRTFTNEPHETPHCPPRSPNSSTVCAATGAPSARSAGLCRRRAAAAAQRRPCEPGGPRRRDTQASLDGSPAVEGTLGVPSGRESRRGPGGPRRRDTQRLECLGCRGRDAPAAVTEGFRAGAASCGARRPGRRPRAAAGGRTAPACSPRGRAGS
jgi:hypothetical protein